MNAPALEVGGKRNRPIATPFADLLPPLSGVEFDALAASIKADGVRVPIVVDELGNILDGHHRYGLDPDAPRKVVKGLTDAGKRAFVLASNLQRRNLSPDQKAELRKKQIEVAAVLKAEGRTQEDIAVMLGVARQTVCDWLMPNAGSGNAHNPPPDARVKLSKSAKAEIFERIKSGEAQAQVAADFGVDQATVSRIVAKKKRERAEAEARKRDAEAAPMRGTIEVADWCDWLPGQPECDLLFTDPPYSTDVVDVQAFAQTWLPVALGKVKPTGRALIFIGAYPEELHAYLSVAMPTQVLVWTYENTLGPTPEYDYKLNWQAILYYRMPEAAPLNGDRMLERFSVHNISAPDGRLGNRYHAWQKPDAIAERLIRQTTRAGDLVLDPFACTGTFLLAAARLGRQARGCEIEERFASIAVERGCLGQMARRLAA